MSDTNRVDIRFTPEYIHRININSFVDASAAKDVQERIDLAQKFTDHIKAIKEWQSRKKSLDFMTDNARKLAGGFFIETADDEIIASIKALTGQDTNIIDMKLFEDCLDILISGIDQHTLIALTGVKNK